MGGSFSRFPSDWVVSPSSLQSISQHLKCPLLYAGLCLFLLQLSFLIEKIKCFAPMIEKNMYNLSSDLFYFSSPKTCFWFIAGSFQASKGHTWRHSDLFSSSMLKPFILPPLFFPLSFFIDSISERDYSPLQFGSHGLLEQHGFARNRFWSIDPDPPPFPTTSSNKAFVDLVLKHSEEDTRIWPHRCKTQIR